MTTVAVCGFTTADIDAASLAAGPGGTVFFPNGQYDVDDLRCTVDDQTWELERGAVIKRTDSTLIPWTLMVCADNFRIRGGTLDANRYVNPTAATGLNVNGFAVDMHGVTVQNCLSYGVISADNDLVMDKCTVRRIGLAGLFWRILAGSPSRNGPRIERCLFDRSLQSDYVSLGAIQISSGNTAAKVWGSKVHGNTVRLPNGDNYSAVGIEMLYNERCSVIGNEVTGGRIGISLGRSNLSTVQGNTSKAAMYYGLELAQNSDNNTCVGNTLWGLAASGGYGVEISGGSDYNKVAYNVIGNFSLDVHISTSAGTVNVGN